MSETSPQFRILGLRLTRRGSVQRPGPGLLAQFDLLISGVFMSDCRLYLGEDGEMNCIGPSCETRRGGVRFADPRLHAEITAAALEAARAFGASFAIQAPER